MGMQAGTATVEKEHGGSSEIKNKTAIQFTNPTLGYVSKRKEIMPWRNICTPMFTIALFAIAKTWRQP